MPLNSIIRYILTPKGTRPMKSNSVILFFLPSILTAATIHVPGDSTTIQAGINGAADGDTVLVQPGTYVENINFNGKNIVVGSLFISRIN